ncbi:hypothetical protein H6P81_017339 [Aristolochia fimbriata]|uniref:Fe2OG dioxygenase domain-containing protein n=1 Tax=Aristolochia fimbriata TaxID=158543 RepID=A0AAV7DXW1_ARIFI|nr:hypothetical protein H6P81_017339 [Aristolochia fimbriata]
MQGGKIDTGVNAVKNKAAAALGDMAEVIKTGGVVAPVFLPRLATYLAQWYLSLAFFVIVTNDANWKVFDSMFQRTRNQEIFEEYVKHVRNLGETLFELISEAVGLRRDRLKEAKCEEGMLVSCHYYPPCPDNSDARPKLGSVQHCDPSFLTLLLQDQIGGLQVFHEGNWVDVTPLHGALVVNVGDFLRLMTNDQLKSVVHRVLVDRVSPRLSVACLYTATTSTTRFGPLKEFVSESNASRYREITGKEYFVHLLSKVKDNTRGLAEFEI